ncbi:unnamed protein product [Heterobilharzia americana]|nr:unnamed protein product [Heterobilharzia americana]
MLSGLSYLQPALLHLPVFRRSVFCLSTHSSSLLCPVFYTLYSVPPLFEHPCTGSSSASPSYSPCSVSFHVSVEIHFLSSLFFLPNTVVQVFFPHLFKRLPVLFHTCFFRDVSRYLPFCLDGWLP